MQLRAQLEDLLCAYLAPLRFDVTVYSTAFAPRRVVVVSPSLRTIIDVEPAKDERLEVAAKPLSRKLKEYFAVRR
jgi:hypothetical protein